MQIPSNGREAQVTSLCSAFLANPSQRVSIASHDPVHGNGPVTMLGVSYMGSDSQKGDICASPARIPELQELQEALTHMGAG